MCVRASGVSRGHTTSRLRSFSATSAARTIKLSAIPFAIFPSVFIEHGATAIASKRNEPLAGGARKSSSLKNFTQSAAEESNIASADSASAAPSISAGIIFAAASLTAQ